MLLSRVVHSIFLPPVKLHDNAYKVFLLHEITFDFKAFVGYLVAFINNVCQSHTICACLTFKRLHQILGSCLSPLFLLSNGINVLMYIASFKPLLNQYLSWSKICILSNVNEYFAHSWNIALTPLMITCLGAYFP